MISASGSRAGPSVCAPSISVSAIAMPKAMVLPDPVWADTSRSRPSASASTTAFCTGVGVVYSRSARARDRAGCVVGKLKGNSRVGVFGPS